MSKQFDCKNRDQYLEMPIEEKRKLYKCSNDYVTIEQIDIIKDQLKTIALDSKIFKSHKINTLSIEEAELFGDKISLWKGDITKLEVDSIVNAANERLLGGQGVDGAIHRGAGKLLLEECRSLHGCKTGEAKLTGGYNLPSKYVIHTVGPIGENPNMLKSCYKSCLELMKANNLLTIAFPCVSTGVFGYPNESAALVAVETVLEFLRSDYGKSVDRIIFTLFLDKDVKIYESIMKAYFDAIN